MHLFIYLFEPPKTLPEFDFYIHPYLTFVFDLYAYPDPAFQINDVDLESQQLDYLYIKKIKNKVV